MGLTGRSPDNLFHLGPYEAATQLPFLPPYLKREGERLDENCPGKWDQEMGLFVCLFLEVGEPGDGSCTEEPESIIHTENSILHS